MTGAAGSGEHHDARPPGSRQAGGRRAGHHVLQYHRPIVRAAAPRSPAQRGRDAVRMPAGLTGTAPLCRFVLGGMSGLNTFMSQARPSPPFNDQPSAFCVCVDPQTCFPEASSRQVPLHHRASGRATSAGSATCCRHVPVHHSPPHRHTKTDQSPGPVNPARCSEPSRSAPASWRRSRCSGCWRPAPPSASWASIGEPMLKQISAWIPAYYNLSRLSLFNFHGDGPGRLEKWT